MLGVAFHFVSSSVTSRVRAIEASTNGIMMMISFALFIIILGIGAANGRFTFVFIYPERLLKFTNGNVVVSDRI